MPAKQYSAPEQTTTNEQTSNITRHKPKPSSAPLHNLRDEKKFELVLYGIEESAPKTSRSKCLQDDLQKVSNIFSSLDSNIQSSSIKTCSN